MLSSLIQNLVVTPEFRKHHDDLHRSILTIQCVWIMPAVCQTPCLCSVGFFNRSDKVPNTSFRDPRQRVTHLYAFQMCFTQRIHGYQK